MSRIQIAWVRCLLIAAVLAAMAWFASARLTVGTVSLGLLGGALAAMYDVYAALLLVGAVFLVHYLALGCYALSLRATGSIGVSVQLALEFLYGFVNPIAYLVVFEPALIRGARVPWLSATAMVVFAAYWSARVLGGAKGAPVASWERVRRAIILSASALLIIGLLVRDLATQGWVAALELNPPFRWLLAIGVLPLYAIPLVVAGRQLWQLAVPSPSVPDSFHLLWPRSIRPVRMVASGVLMGGLLLAAWHEPSRAVREQLLRLRSPILDAARKNQVDPRLIASIVLVTQNEQLSPLHEALERAAAGAWLTDPTSHTLLSSSLNPSLGLAQIKPMTPLTGLVLYGNTHEPEKSLVWNGKQYRDVPECLLSWTSLPKQTLSGLGPPLALGATKADVVETLLSDEGNVAFCAFILGLYQRQWRAVPGAADLTRRPDVLATLYSLGFERSWPKPNPRPNDFGRSVGRVFESDWMRENFEQRP